MIFMELCLGSSVDVILFKYDTPASDASRLQRSFVLSNQQTTLTYEYF